MLYVQWCFQFFPITTVKLTIWMRTRQVRERRLSDSPSFLLNIQKPTLRPSRGVVFRLRISPRIRSQNQNGSKGSARDLWGTNFCKTPENLPHCHVSVSRHTNREYSVQSNLNIISYSSFHQLRHTMLQNLWWLAYTLLSTYHMWVVFSLGKGLEKGRANQWSSITFYYARL